MLPLESVSPGRRQFLQALSVSLAGSRDERVASRPRGIYAPQTKKRHVVLLWMNGGPSQMDTFDLKPGQANGGPFREIATSSVGLRISEHLPRLAKFGDRLAVMRGLSTKEGDHGRGTFVMRTGRMPDPLVRFPTLGSMVAERLSKDDSALPPFVSVNPFLGFEPAAYESGFLGPRYAALSIKPRDAQQGSPFAELGVDNLAPTKAVPSVRSTARLDLLKDLQTNLVKARPRGAVVTHDTVLQKAIQLMNSEAGQVFDLSKEPPMVREKYGTGIFGQGCLLARRLIEKGVPFVEVSLGNGGEWDTHSDNFNRVQQLSQQLDAGWSSPDGRAARTRPARFDDDRLDGRIRPHSGDQRLDGPRPLSQRLVGRAVRRRHQGGPGLGPNGRRGDAGRRRQDRRRRPHRHGLRRGRHRSGEPERLRHR